MTVQDQIKLCKTLAKAEAVTEFQGQEIYSNEQIGTLRDLENEVSSIMAGDEVDFSKGKGSKELFLIFLYMYAQERAEYPEKGLLTLIIEILKKAQAHIMQRRNCLSQNEVDISQKNEEDVTAEMNLEIDISLKNDETLNSLLEVIHAIMRKLVRLGEDPITQLISTIESQILHYLKNTESQVLNLDQFAPTSIVYKLLEYLLRDHRLQFTSILLVRLDKLLSLTFNLFEVYKQNSKFFIITLHSSSSKQEDEKQVRRMSVLFTDLLDLLVGFSCQYLRALQKMQNQGYMQQSIKLYSVLFSSATNEEYFTLRERLRILNELNTIFNQNPEIILTEYYWNMIREGLHDSDQYCRKVSMAVLKTNLKHLGQEKLYSGRLSQQEFELLWTTFFDLYDTLESFGSHLTKAVWERSELFYAYINKNQQQKLHPLLDFKEWLMVLYKRVQSHMNLKLRRYVQKSTLKRKYMTIHLSEYVFEVFLKALNKGLIFKDSNIYTQFSLKNDLVNAFYENYFVKECKDLDGDLQKFFYGFIKFVSHHQLTLCTMRNIARDYPTLRGEQPSKGFIGNEELSKMHDLTNSYFGEQIYSSKYLCWKYMLQMLSLYLNSQAQDLNMSVLLKILGKMPIEFFSNQTNYNDEEGHKHSRILVQRLGGPSVIAQNLIASYLNDLFQIKAQVQQMPKFGNEIDFIIQGVAKLVLIISLPAQQGAVSDPNSHQWFRDIMRPNWEAFQQILSSSYLSPEVLDSKVRYLSILLDTLYKYGDDGLKQALRQDFISKTLHLVLERLENNILIPLTKYETVQHQPSEMGKVHSLFSVIDYYIRFINISIEACHIHMNQSNSSLEKTIKMIFQMGLKVSSMAEEEAAGWGSFFMQNVVYKGLRQITQCYSKGIKKCLSKGISYFMVAEDVFTFGKPLLSSIVQFKQIQKPKDSDADFTVDQQRFLIDNNSTLSLLYQEVLLNKWKTLQQLIQIFQFDKSIREDFLVPLYPVISQSTADFLSCSTRPYHTALFRLLSKTYVPLLQLRLQTSQDASPLLNDYHQTITYCWNIIKDLQTEFNASTLSAFLEFTFNADLLSLLQNNPQQHSFLISMCKELFDQGNKYWLIMRTTFNHIMNLLAMRPQLLQGFFEDFVVGFALCREVRSLDSEILTEKMKTLIPEAVRNIEEKVMEEITYQGAYIRTKTMILIEGMIKQIKRRVTEGERGEDILKFIQGMEGVIIKMIQINYDKQYNKSSSPYSESHRIKVRCWQTIVVLLDFLDPKTIYTPELRQYYSAQFGRDLIVEVNKHLWKAIELNHLPSVRGYIEIVIIKFALLYPELSIEDPNFIKTLLDPNAKITVASSFLLIAGFIMTKLHFTLSTVSGIQLKQKLMEHMSGFLTSNGAHVRCIAQYFMHLISQDPYMKQFIPDGMKNMFEFLQKNKDCQKVIRRHEEEIERMDQILSESMQGVDIVLSTPIDIHGEYLSKPFVERIKEVTSEMMSIIRNHHDGIQPVKRESQWKEELQIRKQEGDLNLVINEASQSNYQRKILPWEQVEYDHELLKRVYEGRRRNEIIMCAALIDKVPNLAGLARTSEIMNASSLVINNRAVCDTDEFKGVSVTSEKWLPIYEVQEKDLFNYLVFQKSNGYKILGLEQTANSKMLNEYKFPSKCIMLLGKEKEGIPQEYLSILDECIEIPQFGVIRSLNVHVSGALCLWEYTKQHLPASCSSKRE